MKSSNFIETPLLYIVCYLIDQGMHSHVMNITLESNLNPLNINFLSYILIKGIIVLITVIIIRINKKIYVKCLAKAHPIIGTFSIFDIFCSAYRPHFCI